MLMLATLAPNAGQPCELPTAEALWRWRRRSANSRSLLQWYPQTHFISSTRLSLLIHLTKSQTSSCCTFGVHFSSYSKHGLWAIFWENKVLNVYNISSAGMFRVNFTGRYLSRSGFTAISITMDPDSVLSNSDLDPSPFLWILRCPPR